MTEPEMLRPVSFVPIAEMLIGDVTYLYIVRIAGCIAPFCSQPTPMTEPEMLRPVLGGIATVMFVVTTYMLVLSVDQSLPD